MQKIVATLLVSLLLVPTGTFAQTITPTATAPWAAKLEISDKPSTLREAAIREARSAVAAGDRLQPTPGSTIRDSGGQAQIPPPAQESPRLNWMGRHPVITGVLAGAAAALALDVACEMQCTPYFPGAMAGGYVGLIVSARKGASYTVTPGLAPDPIAVERAVRGLKIGQKVMVSDVHDVQIRGTVAAINERTFAVDLGGSAAAMEVPYQDVQIVKKQPLGSGTKAGLVIGGVLGGILGVMAVTYGGQ